MKTLALIVAAGSGTRTGLDYPKQYLQINGDTLLARSIDKFLSHPSIDGVQVIINPNDQDLYQKSVGDRSLFPWVSGGATRQASVLNGLRAIDGHNPDYVLIHDAARPFVSHSVIDRCLEALATSDAVLPVVPMIDTLKTIDGQSVTGTLDRNRIKAAQTPQCFVYSAIRQAHERFADQSVTDDITLAELADIAIQWVDGDPDNFKITTAEDISAMTRSDLTDIRTGLGFDVHAFESGRPLWLGGVEIPHDRGLKGHSDADVALHALTDALLGAIGDGDIGTHFPPSDDQWKGASSDQFLEHAASLIAERGGKIGNIDLTIICESPRIGPYRHAIKEKISEILQLDVDRISVKGTTTEKLGFTGRKEGIAAQAIATVRLPE
ncbi:bifunctional 2-C-methyl-D-erythritol 4-phosphate cytidylyltransferase/2-C-methyl-D-erythritol 2,4-cyclodiphosphate synthase [Sneathiella aquimaris]|uniref:bifunctional 2-C-methyl-D-erythritol 4-phosphate cytidylyltransferase/2-C-methyl-D-erythritol 2,4-cyclodiphosphate synthase n=1 Tax=Sneathiella aquimaris TaxID=2599305 RepID=UPI00146AA16E|nr:bifunctional 2-C-methyl-D-erythritol 4-phosphate cytidylyltransferase/2-C-methyl-D-erythritol 2,4-cyclodiphosphate synthase [Sneathiella aquimaris]